MILDDGYRYDGNPGLADYRAIKYDTYGVLLPKPEVSNEVTDRDAMPTSSLMGSTDVRAIAELQWRISMPLLVFIVTLIAVPLSRVNRQDLPQAVACAFFFIWVYLTALILVRGALRKGNISPTL